MQSDLEETGRNIYKNIGALPVILTVNRCEPSKNSEAGRWGRCERTAEFRRSKKKKNISIHIRTCRDQLFGSELLY